MFTISTKSLSIEGDSKLIIDVVKGFSKGNWSIEGILGDVRMLLHGFNYYVINHAYRENNVITNSFIVNGYHLEGLRCWPSLFSLSPNWHPKYLEWRVFNFQRKWHVKAYVGGGVSFPPYDVGHLITITCYVLSERVCPMFFFLSMEVMMWHDSIDVQKSPHLMGY